MFEDDDAGTMARPVSRRGVLMTAAASAAAVPVIAGLSADGARAAVPPTATQPLSVLTMGDSLTNGYQSSDGLGYRRELSRQLSAAGVPHRITNAAQNGGTTADLLRWARPQVAATTPDLVVLAIGTNDAVQSDTSLAAFESNYANLLVQIFYGYPPVKICAAFIGYSTPAWFRPREKQVNDAIFRQAMPGVGPHGTRIIGLADFQLLADYALVDGVHPADAGYDVMGGIVYRVVAGWLATLSAPPAGLPAPCAR